MEIVPTHGRVNIDTHHIFKDPTRKDVHGDNYNSRTTSDEINPELGFVSESHTRRWATASFVEESCFRDESKREDEFIARMRSTYGIDERILRDDQYLGHSSAPEPDILWGDHQLAEKCSRWAIVHTVFTATSRAYSCVRVLPTSELVFGFLPKRSKYVETLLHHEKILKHTTLMDSMLFEIIPLMEDASMREEKAKEILPSLLGAITKQKIKRIRRADIPKIHNLVRREGRGFWQIIYLDRDSFYVSDHDRSECIMVNLAG
jgi:hypothetical protein